MKYGVGRMKLGETCSFTSFLNLSVEGSYVSVAHRTMQWVDETMIKIQLCWVKAANSTSKGTRSASYIQPRYIYGYYKKS